jgi:hypothetical protein
VGGVHENPSQQKKLGFEVCTSLPDTAGSTDKRITAQTSPGKSKSSIFKKVVRAKCWRCRKYKALNSKPSTCKYQLMNFMS